MRHLLRPRRRSREQGATLVEFSLVFVLLLMIALGAFEYGMALRDWISVSIATREGGRVAASAANYNAADCAILEATAGALQSFRTGTIDRVHIYKSDPTGAYPGSPTLRNIYRPAGAGDTPVPACPYWTVVAIGGVWDPSDRLNPSGDPYWIGVRLEFDHDWQTGFLWWSGSTDWTDDSVFRIEPPPPSL